jgi:hypothetical protein
MSMSHYYHHCDRNHFGSRFLQWVRTWLFELALSDLTSFSWTTDIKKRTSLTGTGHMCMHRTRLVSTYSCHWTKQADLDWLGGAISAYITPAVSNSWYVQGSYTEPHGIHQDFVLWGK